jgi:formiminoglutamase
VLVGFPQDEGVRRNLGRPGAAQAPQAIRHWLYRLTPTDVASDIDLADHPPLDAGNLRISGNLEESQHALGLVIGGILRTGAVPIVLGGGHESAYGHYLGYVRAGRAVGILNLDAHLDVRPCVQGQGHSGTPFRQAMEHPEQPLPGSWYVCLGAQPNCVSRQHWTYVRDHGGTIRFADEIKGHLPEHFRREQDRLAKECHVYVTVDADVVQAADVPAVSAPNPLGLSGHEVAVCARAAGKSPGVSSFDLVEVNPLLDPDGRSARWAALAVWHFLMGVAARRSASPAQPPADEVSADTP